MTNLPDFDFGQRLQRLEVSNRRLRAFCMVMLAVFASMFIMGQASSRMLDVERLTIRDRSGVRITLGMETPIQGMPSIPAITMYDEPGKPRLALSVGLSGGASIGLRDESGNWRVFLYQTVRAARPTTGRRR